MKPVVILYLILMILGVSSQVEAQGLYFKLGTGYGIGSGSQTLSEDWEFYNHSLPTDSTFDDKQVNVSLGRGLRINGAVGMALNENISLELGLGYLVGSKNKSVYEYTNGTYSQSLYARMFRAQPAILISTGSDESNLYSKFGLSIGGGKFYHTSLDENSGNSSQSKTKFNGGLALGWNAALGLSRHLSDGVSVFGEIGFESMSYGPSKSELVELTQNGADLLPGLTTCQREAEYSQSLSSEDLTNCFNNPNAPSQNLRQRFPFGAASLSFGVTFHLL